MGNPFDLRGPQFLLFYGVFGVAVNLLLAWWINGRERRSQAAERICTDPYKLAALRAGALELLRVVIFSLIDRGLLKAAGTEVASERQAREVVRRPVEQAVVEFFAKPRPVQEIFADPAALGACGTVCRELAEEGLLSDRTVHLQRKGPVLFALALLAGTALMKIYVALSRGRHNIVFLIILAVAFSIWVLITWGRQRTGAGDEVLEKAVRRFKPLKERAGSILPGGMTGEATYLAALFGLSSLPTLFFPYITTLFPRAAAGGDSSSGGCGGGGCGGGGCGGGGCGGCGG